ncbi:MAG: MltA domain-containing protein [Proteobacteria bacterium]|nr:MltA domain-containing protein [Pseudomonadota bacterium]MBU1716603.1 MltA domain-containing protein [Pseudomonadota bacterium]
MKKTERKMSFRFEPRCLFAQSLFVFLNVCTLFNLALPGNADGRNLVFSDDFSKESLEKAVGHSVDYLRKIPATRRFLVCGREYDAAWLIESLRSFMVLKQEDLTAADFSEALSGQFEICGPGNQDAGDMLVTGYYEPLFDGSLERSGLYQYPLYQVPADLAVMIGGSEFNGRKVGRLDGGRFVPYWSRAEIEEQGLLTGRELVFLTDPVEAFIMHVQGSGQVRLPDGSIRHVQYAAKNGRLYRSIGRLLVDEGKMSLEEVDLPGLVRYLAAHPENRKRILNYNESFVFFRWGDDAQEGPIGCLGEVITAGRSVALDHNVFPSAGLAFLKSQQPFWDESGRISGWVPMTRFVLNQDSGSAIKGKGRLDFFWGRGQKAEAAAGKMKHPGTLFFLIKKK